jgi:ParB family transcriptional regulator, chromosome partitioning protein
MEQRRSLGRGLDALIPTNTTLSNSQERVQMLKVAVVEASRFQPRLNFAFDKIEELANSIREKGIMQPVLVRAIDNFRYELIAGERRLRAAKLLSMEEIPAIVRRVSDADLLEMSIIENIQREQLNPIDEAKAYRRLAQEFGFSQDTIAQRVGKDKSTISNLLRVLNLPEAILEYVSRNMISLGHAKALLAVTEPKRQMALCEEIIEKGLSVRQMELVANKKPRLRSAKINKDMDIKNLEDNLQKTLGTKVRVYHGKKRGKIEIEYYSLDDLDRVLQLMGVPKL